MNWTMYHGHVSWCHGHAITLYTAMPLVQLRYLSTHTLFRLVLQRDLHNNRYYQYNNAKKLDINYLMSKFNIKANILNHYAINAKVDLLYENIELQHTPVLTE